VPPPLPGPGVASDHEAEEVDTVIEWRNTPYAKVVHASVAAARFSPLDAGLVEAIVAGLSDADLLAAPRGQQLRAFHVTPCHYISKACEHRLHNPDGPGDFCRLTCKFCGTPCQCPDPGCRHGAARSPEPDRRAGLNPAAAAE
jgi:hypothetical protein